MMVPAVSTGRQLPSAGVKLAKLGTKGTSNATLPVKNGSVQIDVAGKFVHSSMYESCLQACTGRSEPQILSVQNIEDALQRDRMNQIKKYGGLEPNGKTARFNAVLPVGPQHTKFCLATCRRPVSGRYERGDSPEDQKQTSQCRFNMSTLRKWFKEKDVRHCGSITQRELIVALRQRKDLQAVLCVVNGLDAGGMSGCSTPSVVRGSPGPPPLTTEVAAADARREEVRRIKKIWDDVNSEDNDSIDWIEFVEFFRRAGVLLEYQTQYKRQARDSICRKSFLLQAQHTEAKAERAERAQKVSELQKHHRESLVVPRKFSEILSKDLIQDLARMTALEEIASSYNSSDGDED